MGYKKSELRDNSLALLRRTQRQMESKPMEQELKFCKSKKFDKKDIDYFGLDKEQTKKNKRLNLLNRRNMF